MISNNTYLSHNGRHHTARFKLIQTKGKHVRRKKQKFSKVVSLLNCLVIVSIPTAITCAIYLSLHNPYVVSSQAAAKIETNSLSIETETTVETNTTCGLYEQAEKVAIYYDVPAAETGQKTFMDYRAITDTTSDQYHIQQRAWTDENGFRRYGDDYLVAMGTYYAEKCGKRFEITLENGTVFTAMIGDIKQDRHTDALHQHSNGNVLEFIVDDDVISDLCWYHGDMSFVDGVNFKGKIVSIKEIQA